MLNQNLSQKFKEKYPQYAIKNQCYRNVYGLCTTPEFQLNKVKILFCYLPVGTYNLYYRHAILNCDGQYIDTVLDIPEKYENLIIIREFSFREYMDAVIAEGSLELRSCLYSAEQQLIEARQLEIIP